MARSTLELLLDSIKDRDEEPPDHLPALPQRPTSRGRLPSRKRTSALLLGDPRSQQPYGQIQHEAVHPSDASRHHSNGTSCSEAHLMHSRGDGYSPAFQNGYGKLTENGDRCTQDNSRVKLVTPQSTLGIQSSSNKENRLSDGGGLIEPALISKKAPAPAYTNLRKRRRVNHLHDLQKDSRVWFLNEDNNWVLGIIQSVVGDSDTTVVCMAGDKHLEIPPERLLPANPELLDGVDDLVQLSYIHEPAVFHALQQRYERGTYCTRAGSLCIVVTPPKEETLDSLQSCCCSHAFKQSPKELNSMTVGSKQCCTNTIVDNAYNSLIEDWNNQSIVIGGECSAGKAESAQAVLKHLVFLGNNGELGKTLLISNMIWEAFGNTNIASGVSMSRYGKLVDVNFDKGGNLCGAHVQIVFLEKSRVVCPAENEHSYRIFYQLCEGADASLREKLDLREATHFNYLKSSASSNGAHSSSDFQSLLNALHTLGITEKSQQDIFSLLGAILWLGNVTAAGVNNNEAVDNAAKLLSCTKQELMEALGYGGPNSEDVYVARDALACAIYERLFNWLVVQINDALKPKTVSDFKSTTIVDMPGLGFSKNDHFEGLLANYVQEHLQHFTQWHLLQQGEEVATCEGLRSHVTNFSRDDESINFLDNELFPLLANQEGRALSEQSDSGFLRSVERLLAGSSLCKGSHSGTVTVSHASGEATYNLDSFLKEMKAFSCSRTSRILHFCMADLPVTIGIGFSCKGSLEEFSSRPFSSGQERVLQMMHQLEETKPHFIFCMAPSESKRPQLLEQGYVVRQLRVNKIIESVRLCKSGYLISIPHRLFASRFGPLVRPDIKKVQSPLGISVAVLQQLQVPSYSYQMGWARIFLCPEQVNKLEHARKQFSSNIIDIQKAFRGYRLRKQLERQKMAVTHLQAYVRGWLVRRGFSHQGGGKPEIENSEDECKVATKPVLEPASQDCEEDGGYLVKEETDTTLPNGRLADLQQENYLPKKRGNKMQAKSFHGYVERMQPTDPELGLKRKEEEIAILQQSVKEYERKWLAYEAKMKSMEEMWQKQVTSLEQRLSVATKGSNTEESAYKTGDSDKGVMISTPPHYDTPETTSGDPDVTVAKNELDPSRSVLDHLSKELEHRTQVFNDDAKFLVEVKSGQIAASFKPDEELQKLSQRFELWKKDYKGRLKETKGILKKLGKLDAADKNKKRWWSRK